MVGGFTSTLRPHSTNQRLLHPEPTREMRGRWKTVEVRRSASFAAEEENNIFVYVARCAFGG